MWLLGELEMTPGGVISWIVVGLVSGWLAGKVMSGGGYGMVRDTLLGLVAPSWAGSSRASSFTVRPVFGAASWLPSSAHACW